jgi:hypothetical protein
VPRRDTYAPKHRGATTEPAPRTRGRRSLLSAGVACAATGLAVSSGVVTHNEASGDPAAAVLASARSVHRAAPVSMPFEERERRIGDRSDGVSRSDRRTPLRPRDRKRPARTASLTSRDPRDVARSLLPDFGFSGSEFSCLDALYMSESGWKIHADNPGSSAYGIPQALPGSKMASACPDWQNNPATQIRWGLTYIKGSYGTPCGAWSFKESHGWY